MSEESIPAIMFAEEMMNLSVSSQPFFCFPPLCLCLQEMGGGGSNSTEGQEEKWNPHTEKKRKEQDLHKTFFHPITPVYKGNGDVTHFTFWGTMVAGRKQQVKRGLWVRWVRRVGLLRVLKKFSVLFTIDTMVWLLRLQHNNTCGFKFLPSLYSLHLLPLILCQPLTLIHHMATAQRHEFPIYWDFSVITLRGGGGGRGWGYILKVAEERNTLHSSITPHNKRKTRGEGGSMGMRVHALIKISCLVYLITWKHTHVKLSIFEGLLLLFYVLQEKAEKFNFSFVFMGHHRMTSLQRKYSDSPGCAATEDAPLFAYTINQNESIIKHKVVCGLWLMRIKSCPNGFSSDKNMHFLFMTNLFIVFNLHPTRIFFSV